MNTEIIIPTALSQNIQQIASAVATWCSEHQVTLGVGEMAAGGCNGRYGG